MKIKSIKLNRIIPRKLNKKSIIMFLEILCFFELFSISRMEAEGIAYPIPSLILNAFAIGRMLISAGEISIFLRNRGKRYSRISYWIFAFCISLLIAPIMNRYMVISTVVAIWSYIGFALFCDRMLRNNTERFFNVLLLFFGAISIVDLIGIFVFPLDIATDYSFAGGKNAAFDYNLIFLFLLFKTQKISAKKLRILTLIFIFGGIVRQSVNTIICLSILFLLLFLFDRNKMPGKKAGARLIVPMVVIIEGFTLSVTVFARSSRLLSSLMNYDIKFTTFSGRTFLWEQAINAFIKSPLGGGMNGETFKIPTFLGFIEYSHPHNKFLGILAGDGIIPVIILFALLIYITWKTKGKYYSDRDYVEGVFLFCFLIHMLFDDTSYFRFFMVLIIYCYQRRFAEFASFQQNTSRLNKNTQVLISVKRRIVPCTDDTLN